MNETIIALGANLVEITARNTASIINDKIKRVKAKKEDKKTIGEMEEIINDLINDKYHLERIAKSFEEELITQKITDKDIEYITKNIIPIISNFIPEENREQLEQLKKLLSVESLTIMQLIGFNYKKAIGEPLTMLLRKNIEQLIPSNHNNYDFLLGIAELAKDEEATMRFCQLTGYKMENNSENKSQV